MSRRKQQKPRHLDADQNLDGILENEIQTVLPEMEADPSLDDAGIPEDEDHQSPEHIENGETHVSGTHVCGKCQEEFLELSDFLVHKHSCNNKRIIPSYEDEDEDEELTDGLPPAKRIALENKADSIHEEDSDLHNEEEGKLEMDLQESELISQYSEKSDYREDKIDEDEECIDEEDRAALHRIDYPDMHEDDDEGASPHAEDKASRKLEDIPDSHLPTPLSSMNAMAALLPDTNVKLASLDSTKVAVAQFAENNMAPNDFAVLQTTLYSLQQQQLFQLQLLQQIQNQLIAGHPPSLAGLPPGLIPPQMAASLASLGLQLPPGAIQGSAPPTDKAKSPSSDNSPSTLSKPTLTDFIAQKKKELSTLATSPTTATTTTTTATSSPRITSTDAVKKESVPLPPMLQRDLPESEANMNLYRQGEEHLRHSSFQSPLGKPPNVTVGALDRNEYAADDPFFKHKCRFCHKVFGSDSALQIHIRSHTGERPFKCNICGNRFSTRGNLKVHFVRHKDQYPNVKMNPNPVPEHLDRPNAPVLIAPVPSPQTSGPIPPSLIPPPTPVTPVEPKREKPAAPISEPTESSSSPIVTSAQSVQKSPNEASQASEAPLRKSPDTSETAATTPKPISHLGMISSAAARTPGPFGPLFSMSPMSFTPTMMTSLPRPGMHLPPGMGSPQGMSPFGFHENQMFRPSILPAKVEDPLEQYMEVDKSETNKLQQLVDNIESKLTDPNQCAICHRILSCKSALQMHYRTHTGERPFKCKICGRAFTTKGNLKTHMGVHRAKPPVRMLHQCPVCHKQFTNALVLQQHIRMHTGDLPKDMPMMSPEMMGPMGGMPFMPMPGYPFLPPGFPFPGGPPGMNGELDLRKAHLMAMEGHLDEDDDDMYDDMDDDMDVEEYASNIEKSYNSEKEGEEEQNVKEADVKKEKVESEPKEKESPLNQENIKKEEINAKEKEEETEKDKLNSKESVQRSSSPLYAHSMYHQPGLPPTTGSYSTSLLALEERVKAIEKDSERTFSSSRPLEQMANILRRQENELSPHKLHNGNASPMISPKSSDAAKSPGASKERPLTTSSPYDHSESSNNSLEGDNSFRGVIPPYGLSPLSFAQQPFGGGKMDTTCDICFKTFACRSALDIHYRSHTKERPFRCQVCDRGFSTKGNMRQHMLTHKIRDLPDMSDDSREETEFKEEEEKQQVSPNSSSVKSESAISPASSGDDRRPGPPPLISTPSSSSTDSTPSPFLKRSGSKHVCQMCHKPFSSASALQIHIRTHTGDKPFKCTVCGKAFTTKGNLKVHMGTHMWTNTPSRRGRRMSIDSLPAGLMPSPKDADFYNSFAHRPHPEMFPYPFPGFHNGFGPKMNEISVIQSLNGTIPHLPIGMPHHPPTSIATPEALMKSTEAMLKAEDAMRKENKPLETNNNTPSGASGELDLSIRKSPTPSKNASPHSDPKPEGRKSPEEGAWSWKLTCHLCNKLCSSASALDIHIKSHIQQRTSEQASPKSVMT